MTLGTNNLGEPTVTLRKKEFITFASALSGVIALIGFLSFWAVIPERVNRLEIHDKEQDSRLAEMQSDNMQRREMLAAALAELRQINDRTKRIEDSLLTERRPTSK